jgi:hypothetical protein
MGTLVGTGAARTAKQMVAPTFLISYEIRTGTGTTPGITVITALMFGTHCHTDRVNVQYYIEVPRITGTQSILAAQQCPISYSLDHPRPVAVLELGGTASSSVSSRHESVWLQFLYDNHRIPTMTKILIMRRH